MLFQPEIPQNTGAIARLVAATCCRLHLIEPLGFELSDRSLKRAGLDYWPFLDLEIHASFADFLEIYPRAQVAAMSKFAVKTHYGMDPQVDTLLFGRETTGLPQELKDRYAERLFKLPMEHEGVRSLNLATAVSAALYFQLGNSGVYT